MAGALNFGPPPLFRSLSTPEKSNGRVSFRVSAQIQETSSSVSAKEEKKLGFSGSDSSPTISPPPNFKPPEPKRFAIRPDKIYDVLSGFLALPFRLGLGVFTLGYSASFVSKDEIPPGKYAFNIAGLTVKETSKLGPRPEKPIEIYEFESCPFCRKVREIVTVLDLDVLYYPCPKNGPNFRPKVSQMGGKQQFPYMVDPNTGVAMYESDEIIKYLVNKYGDGSIPLMLSLGLLTTLTAGFAMLGRLGKGSYYTPSRIPQKPLELWAYEASPFCKLVREVLVELELPHIYYSTGRGSPKRQILYEKTKHFQAPYLEDPNTGVKMYESADIIDYLRATYVLPEGQLS